MSNSLSLCNLTMALKIFAKEKKTNHQPPTQWLVNVNRKVGCFNLNNLITDDLKLETGQRGLIAYDEDTKEWFVAFGEDLPGFTLKILTNSNYAPRLMFLGRLAAHTILNDVKAQIGATFIISKRPKVIDGQKWYRILTKNPKRVN